MSKYSAPIAKTRDYYDSDNMLNFHNFIYGEHIHIGIYKTGNESIIDANVQTLQTISELLKLNSASKVLDLGSGYGGADRYLAEKFGCSVDGVNLSSAEKQINRNLNQQRGLDKLIQVFDGSFQEIPTSDSQYDTVLSQYALLYSNDRLQVFQEVFRVLQSGGQFLLTDVMFTDNCPQDFYDRTVEIVNVQLASFQSYRAIAKQVGFEEIHIIEMPEQVTNQYQKTLDCLEENFDELLTLCDREFLEYQRVRLNNWIKIGHQNYLNWGILHFCKP